jgi:hypothetical protein
MRNIHRLHTSCGGSKRVPKPSPNRARDQSRVRKEAAVRAALPARGESGGHRVPSLAPHLKRERKEPWLAIKANFHDNDHSRCGGKTLMSRRRRACDRCARSRPVETGD